jgi:membrane protease subunit (stomatin/prohibitin family)
MKETKSLVVRLEGRSFVLEVDNSEEDLISGMMSALGSFIRKGVPIKVVQTSAPSMSKSQSMWTKILTNLKELGDWVETLKKLGRVHRSRP